MEEDKPKTKYVYNKTRKKKPVSRSSRDYDFLQYIRIVFRWAISYSNLTRGEVEALLYLYPKGTFKKSDFFAYQRTVSMYQARALDKFVEEGWLYLYRPRKGNKQMALYAMTSKGKIMCSKMHQFLTGEKDIPIKTKTNPLIKSDKRIDGYYMDMIVKMNKEREARKKQEGDE